MSEKQDKFNKLIDELILLGESKEELEFWRSFFDKLNDTEQSEILLLLEEEKNSLRSI